MKIKFLSGPRAGQIDHAPISQETDLLVKAGIIEVIPYKGYQERLKAEEELRMASQPKIAAQWGIRRIMYTNKGLCCVVVKMDGPETTFYDSPPTGCPRATAAEWKKQIDLEHALSNDVNRIHKEKQEHYVREKSGGGESNNAGLARFGEYGAIR